MAPPKKAQKMSLGNFLADESLGGSWADEMEDDYPPISSGPSASTGYQRREYSSAAPSSTAPSGDRFAGYSRTTDDHFSSRQQLPIPDKPPYTAHVGNLSFDVSEAEIEGFFTGCDVANVRLVRDRLEDRPKGFGYVEYSTKEGLIKALDLNGAQLAGRNVRISVAEPPKERQDSRFEGEWRRSGPLPDLPATNRRGPGYERSDSHRSEREERSHDRESRSVRPDLSWERKGPLSPLPPTTPTSEQERPGYRRRSPAPNAEGRGSFRGDRPAVERQPSAAESESQWRRAAPPQRSNPTSPVMAHVRPKLDLKKRSEAAPSDINTPATASSDKPNPFGAAKPIDTLKREKEVEEKRAQLAAEKKAAEEKAREEKKAAAAAAAEAEAKAAEDAAAATTPTAEKKFENLRRGSAAPSEGEKPAAVEEKKIEKSRGPDNWRARTAVPPKEPIRRQNTQSRQQQQQQQQPAAAQEKEEQSVTPAAEPQEDGWNTVTKPKKRGGRA